MTHRGSGKSSIKSLSLVLFIATIDGFGSAAANVAAKALYIPIKFYEAKLKPADAGEALHSMTCIENTVMRERGFITYGKVCENDATILRHKIIRIMAVAE